MREFIKGKTICRITLIINLFLLFWWDYEFGLLLLGAFLHLLAAVQTTSCVVALSNGNDGYVNQVVLRKAENHAFIFYANYWCCSWTAWYWKKNMLYILWLNKITNNRQMFFFFRIRKVPWFGQGKKLALNRNVLNNYYTQTSQDSLVGQDEHWEVWSR